MRDGQRVRRWLANYQELKRAIEAICELNHELLRPDEAAARKRTKRRELRCGEPS